MSCSFDNNVPKFFSILKDFNLNDFRSATVTGHNDYSKSFSLQTP